MISDFMYVSIGSTSTELIDPTNPQSQDSFVDESRPVIFSAKKISSPCIPLALPSNSLICPPYEDLPHYLIPLQL